jgi:hypothetical protein
MAAPLPLSADQISGQSPRARFFGTDKATDGVWSMQVFENRAGRRRPPGGLVGCPTLTAHRAPWRLARLVRDACQTVMSR